MTVYIDPPRWPAHGTRFSHLVSDTSYDELHAVARRAGLPRRAFDLDHYDVPESRYADAIAAGARAVSGRELVRRLHASGLRVQPADRVQTAAHRRLDDLRASWASLATTIEVADARVDSSAPVPAPDAPATTPDASPRWLALGELLLERWGEPHRHYHDLTHLHDVLLALDELEGLGVEVAPTARLAAWFHDAVYDGEPGDDERASAQLARTCLGKFPRASGIADETARLVLATLPGTTTAPGDAACALLDADLAILAAGADRYRAYTQAVRAEYAHVPDGAFRAARAQIMSTFLKRPTIYLTPQGRSLWEARARANVAAEVARLRA